MIHTVSVVSGGKSGSNNTITAGALRAVLANIAADVPISVLDGGELRPLQNALRIESHNGRVLHHLECVPRATPRHTLIRAGEIEISTRSRQVTVAGRLVELTGREFALLIALAADPHRIFTKEELLTDVWGFKTPGKSRTLDSHANRLRTKIGHEYVHNLWAVGYSLLAANEQVAARA